MALLSCLLLIVILFNGGCVFTPSKTGPENQKEIREVKGMPPEKAVKVVTTIFPLADIIKQIGKEAVEVTILLTPGASPHTYEPTAEQARAVAKADVLVFVGGGLDDWAMKLASAGEKLTVLEIMKCLKGQILEYNPLPLGGNSDRVDNHAHEHGHGKSENYDTNESINLSRSGEHRRDEDYHFPKQTHLHRHMTHDPHVWMDPLLVKDLIAPLLAGELKSVYPKKAVFFEDNLESFRQELEDLHKEMNVLTGSFSQKRFISYHSAWNYFARRYGLEEVAAVEDSPGKEPSAKWLSELVALADLHDIRVIFAEVQLGTRVAEIVAREIDGRVLLLDPLGGKGLDGREDYLQLMRYNARIFQEALQ